MNMNHISNLPDCVLSNILSRLSLKGAVQTSVLSTDWQFKWTSMYKVDINIGDFSPELENELNFFTHVQRALHRLQSVKHFIFMCSSPLEHEWYGMMVLVPAISRHNVKRLELDICNTQDFSLPCSIWTFTSIKHLSVVFEKPSSFTFQATNNYPCLKSLTLEKVKIVNDTPNTDTLVFTLPVLKSLELIECEWVKVKFVEINAPKLYTLKSVTPSEWEPNTELYYVIKIVGAGLNELETRGGYPEHISVIGSQVAYAHLLYICDKQRLSPAKCGLQMRKLLRELPYLENLYIEDIEAIDKTNLELSLPRFRKLRTLHLGLSYDAEPMLEFLHAAPFLKHLVIYLNLDEDETENDYKLDSVEPLPYCIVHCLEKVSVYYNYVDKSPKFSLSVEKFLMKNGAQLKTMFISGRDIVSEKEIFEKLTTFPKASACLEIVGRLTGSSRTRPRFKRTPRISNPKN